MASLMDHLRRLIGLKAGSDAPEKAVGTDRGDAFQTLSEQFLACEDEAQCARIWEEMCRVLPETLFLAAMCFEGDDPNASVRDRELHATVGSQRLYARNQHIVTRGNPGYRLAKKADSCRMHLRSLIYHKTKEEWVPLFTDFTRLLPVFGQSSRVTVISFEEARRIAKVYTGIVINPGKDAIRLSSSELKKVK